MVTSVAKVVVSSCTPLLVGIELAHLETIFFRNVCVSQAHVVQGI